MIKTLLHIHKLATIPKTNQIFVVGIHEDERENRRTFTQRCAQNSIARKNFNKERLVETNVDAKESKNKEET